MPSAGLNNTGEADKVPPGFSSVGRFLDGNTLSNEAERRRILTRKVENEIQNQETEESQAAFSTAPEQPDPSGVRGGLVFGNSNMGNGHLSVGRADHASSLININKQGNPGSISWTGIGSQSEFHGSMPERKDDPLSLSQSCSVSGKQNY